MKKILNLFIEIEINDLTPPVVNCSAQCYLIKRREN
jgi:hypothetical protein